MALPLRRRWPAVTALLTLLSSVAVATLAVVAPSFGAGLTGWGSNDPSAVTRTTATPRLGVTVGRVTGLHPGGPSRVTVRYANPFGFSVAVASQKVTVTSPAAGCLASNLVAPAGTVRLTKPLALKPHRSGTTTVPVARRPDAPKACQRVAFTVTVWAQAVKR